MSDDIPNLLDYLSSPPVQESPVEIGPGTALAEAAALDQKFWTWLYDNPGLYEEIVRKADAAARNGHRRLSMKGLFESLRWDSLASIRPDEDGWKLNNSYTAPMVRLLKVRRPDLGDLFETRERRSA